MCIAPRLKEIIKIITATFFMKFVEVANKLLSKTKTRKNDYKKLITKREVRIHLGEKGV